MAPATLSPNEVALLAGSSRVAVEKALEQKVLISRSSPTRGRQLPLYAVAIIAASQGLGRRLSVADKKLLAEKLGDLSSRQLKSAEIEIVPGVVVRVGSLAREAVERAEHYTAARDTFIECVEGVQGGRPVIRGTRVTVSAICGRLTSGDAIEDLVEDYPEIPREAFEVARLFGQAHPQVGRPATRPTDAAA